MNILLLISLVALLDANQMPSTAFSSMQVTITPGNSPAFINNATANYNFGFTLESPLTGMTRVFLALAGFSMNSNTSFDFFTNLIFTNPAVVLEFNSFGDLEVYQMTFCVISTTFATYPYLDVQEYLIVPQNLSDPTFTETANPNFELRTLYSNLQFTHSSIIVIPYISYLKSQCGTYQTGAVLLLNKINNGTSSFVLNIVIDLKGTLSILKTTIIIVDLIKVHQLKKIYFANIILVYKTYYSQNQTYFASQVTPAFFPSVYGPKFSRNCTLGLYLSLNNKNRKHKTMMFNYSTNLGFTDIQEGGEGFAAFYYGFCLAECMPNSYYNSSTGKCENCGTYMPNCQNCTNSTYCLSCGLNAFFDSLRKECRCRGSWVVGGCTAISYCLEIDPSSGRCLSCSSSFTLSTDGMSCDCAAGNAGMSGVCISVSGCLTAAVVQGKVQCVACNTSANFKPSLNYTCSCESGLTLTNGSCLPFCGDGVLYLGQACDDGNTINGDGCSSICTMEKYYVCKNGSSTHKSDCYYANRNVKLTLTRTYKEAKGNSGVFVFTFTPAPSVLSKIDFNSAVTFTIAPRHQIASIAFQDSQLTIKTSYEQDLQDKDAVLSLKLDKNIILQNQYTLSFAIKSSNYPLIVFTHYDDLINLQLGMNILVGATLLLFMLGSWAHKMIGVQTLSVFLSVYFSLSIEKIGSEQLFSPLGRLRYLGNYGDVFQEKLGGHSQVVSMLQLRQQFIENNFIIQFMLVAGVLILVGLALYHQISLPENGCQQSSIFNYYPFLVLFYVFLLPLALGYFSQTFITAILSFVAHDAPNFPFNTTSMLLGLSLPSIIISLECLNANSTQVKRKENYFVFFTAYHMIFVLLLVLAWQHTIFISLLGAVSLAYLTYLIVSPPYKQRLHVFGVVLNQLALTSWMGIIIAVYQGAVSERNKYLFICAIIVLLIVVDLIAGFRIVHQLYFCGPQTKKLKQIMQMHKPILKKQGKRQKCQENDKIKQLVTDESLNFPCKQRNEIKSELKYIGRNLAIDSLKIYNEQTFERQGRAQKQAILMKMKVKLRETLLNQQMQEY